MHVAYLPGERIIGLSEIARLVNLFARRFQVQERLTEQVADALVELLQPKGVQIQHSNTTTRALRGIYATDAQARQEALAMLGPLTTLRP